MALTARRLVIGLLSASLEPVPVRAMIKAGELFEISANSVRVALARLRSDGLAEAAQRGLYIPGPAAAALEAEVGRWREVEGSMCAWDGSWIAVHTAALPRADRTALRRRTRALEIHGFRELAHGLELRPANLEGGVDEVRMRLQAVGLEPEALVYQMTLPAARLQAATALWNVSALEHSYRSLSAEMRVMTAEVTSWPIDRAARDVYLMGDRALRAILFDPRLPAPLIDTDLRSAFFALTLTFEARGRVMWSDLLETSLGEWARRTA